MKLSKFRSVTLSAVTKQDFKVHGPHVFIFANMGPYGSKISCIVKCEYLFIYFFTVSVLFLRRVDGRINMVINGNYKM